MFVSCFWDIATSRFARRVLLVVLGLFLDYCCGSVVVLDFDFGFFF